MSVNELGVWLHGQQVAVLRAPKTGRVTCKYLAPTLDEYPLNIPMLSCSLPLRTGRRDALVWSTRTAP